MFLPCWNRNWESMTTIKNIYFLFKKYTGLIILSSFLFSLAIPIWGQISERGQTFRCNATGQKLEEPCDNKPDELICRQKRHSGKYRLKKQIEDTMTAELMRNQRINWESDQIAFHINTMDVKSVWKKNVIEIKAFFSVENHFSCRSVNCLEN